MSKNSLDRINALGTESELEHSGIFRTALERVVDTAEQLRVVTDEDAQKLRETPRNKVAEVLQELDVLVTNAKKTRTHATPVGETGTEHSTDRAYTMRILKTAIRRNIITTEEAVKILAISDDTDRSRTVLKISEQLAEDSE